MTDNAQPRTPTPDLSSLRRLLALSETTAAIRDTVPNKEDDSAAVAAEPTEKRTLMLLDMRDESIGDNLLSVVETIKTEGRLMLRGDNVTLADIRRVRALLQDDGYSTLIEPGLALGSVLYIAIHPRDASEAEKRDFLDQVYRDIRQSSGGSIAFESGIVGAAIRQDPGYRLSWIANLAQSFVMAGMEHYAAQQGAANFLDIFAWCDVRKDEHFQHSEREAGPRCFTVQLDKDDPAPYQTVEFILQQLTGKDNGKPRIRMRDGAIIYVLEEDNVEVAVVQVPAQ